MEHPQILIVEDDLVIAMDMEHTLKDAGWDVCGIAASEAEAVGQAERLRPAFAIVDVHLSPGDGRNVSKQLSGLYHTAVLMATSHCNDSTDLSCIGAIGCLPKPYSPASLVRAMDIVRDVRDGVAPASLPNQMRLFV